MGSKKASKKLLALLDREAVKERQKELRAMAKKGAPTVGLATAETESDDGCVWVPEDVIVIGPSGVPRVETRWRRVCP